MKIIREIDINSKSNHCIISQAPWSHKRRQISVRFLQYKSGQIVIIFYNFRFIHSNKDGVHQKA
ncbi:hypothetical protein HYC85_027594 [Camellia sinensis]|uniref:Uncharacterized protein n=1 Tax=Camellia sinensis TaxID=4442 RepID=A0A7J7G850_CAMSI|nr:hypothetical protein HYC85_027594 [Camellia sinensis]